MRIRRIEENKEKLCERREKVYRILLEQKMECRIVSKGSLCKKTKWNERGD